jgi:hypothetical protein
LAANTASTFIGASVQSGSLPSFQKCSILEQVVEGRASITLVPDAVEHAHHVLTNELAAEALPSQKFAANAAWFRLNVLLDNLLSAFKRVALPPELHPARPKRLRFVLLNTVGKVVRHAREAVLRLVGAGAANWPPRAARSPPVRRSSAPPERRRAKLCDVTGHRRSPAPPRQSPETLPGPAVRPLPPATEPTRAAAAAR